MHIMMHAQGSAASATSHWTQHQSQCLKQGMQVTASQEADDGSMQDLLLIRKMSSRCMCNSASLDRTWVELQDQVVREYAHFLKSRRKGAETAAGEPADSVSQQQQQQQQRAGRKTTKSAEQDRGGLQQQKAAKQQKVLHGQKICKKNKVNVI